MAVHLVFHIKDDMLGDPRVQVGGQQGDTLGGEGGDQGCQNSQENETSTEVDDTTEQEESAAPEPSTEPVIVLTPEQKLDEIIDATIAAMPSDEEGGKNL